LPNHSAQIQFNFSKSLFIFYSHLFFNKITIKNQAGHGPESRFHTASIRPAVRTERAFAEIRLNRVNAGSQVGQEIQYRNMVFPVQTALPPTIPTNVATSRNQHQLEQFQFEPHDPVKQFVEPGLCFCG
jgi:hypothetical protein